MPKTIEKKFLDANKRIRSLQRNYQKSVAVRRQQVKLARMIAKKYHVPYNYMNALTNEPYSAARGALNLERSRLVSKNTRLRELSALKPALNSSAYQTLRNWIGRHT